MTVPAPAPRRIAMIHAPCHLGLRPPREDHPPGTWRAPRALARAGLDAALAPVRTIAMPRPDYAFDVRGDTLIRNAAGIRAFCEALAGHVEAQLKDGCFPVAIGGDCSILLGCLAGARRIAPLGLVHIDGHSDFRHPGNYDAASVVSGVAGMDLALATGRGEAVLTQWDELDAPLVADARVVQLGERECRDPDYAFADIHRTAIRQLDIFWILEHGIDAAIEQTLARMDGPFWLHVDVDVLDQRLMPAVDSPGSPGLDFDQLGQAVASLAAAAQCVGLNVTVFDPDIDPDGRYAALLADCLGQALRRAHA
ncbi:arginase family protein [Burkholderia alba]|uniref:arginase family protein n=1 Tax=Burkholderia alba TaxID=2683677 RepID=UPI002B052E23|nr:arginase family protein [Burkholderia alba]